MMPSYQSPFEIPKTRAEILHAMECLQRVKFGAIRHSDGRITDRSMTMIDVLKWVIGQDSNFGILMRSFQAAETMKKAEGN